MKNSRYVVLVAGVLAIASSQPAFAFGKKASNPTPVSSPTPVGTNLAVPGVTGPIFAINGTEISITMVLNTVQVSVGAAIPINGMPNSYISLSPDLASGGTDLTVVLDGADIALAKKLDLIQPDTLPGGRPLPGLPAGSLPAIAVQLKQLDNAVVYIGPSIFGVFVPINLKAAGIILTQAFYNSSHVMIGALSLVSDDSSNKNGGLLLLVNDSAVGNILK